jgi:diguanylate cyclase (GGDEF)-like protein
MNLVHSQKLSQKLIEEQALLIQKLQAELVKWRERAERDALSGCLRRESFMELIETRRSFGLLNAETTLVIIDIDHFKKVNDTHGHLAGDEALRHIARLLKERLPEGALLCRMGGEEFAMLLNGNVESNRSYLESLRIQIAQTPAKIAQGKRLSLTASFGAVTWKTHTAFVSAAADADLLLYKAKNEGRNRIAA